MRHLLITCLVLALPALAHADSRLKFDTPKGKVECAVGDGWTILSKQLETPVATVVFQIPNPADADTPESTNLALVLYDLATSQGKTRFDLPLPQYTEDKPEESSLDGWTLYRHEGMQNEVEYTILDARKQRVGDVAATVRLAWPRLPGNDADYDLAMEKIFRTFLAGVKAD